MKPSADLFDPADYIHEKLPSLEDRMMAEIEHRILIARLSSTLILSPDVFYDSAITVMEEVIKKHGFKIDHPLVSQLGRKTLAVAFQVLEKA